MFRFFRTLRHRLLTENRVSRYLLYAVGEILLVMIGILLALQVNNWNEERKSRGLELEILKELKSTLESEFDLMAEHLKWNRKSLLSCYLILNAVSEDLAFHDSLSTHFTQAFTRNMFLMKDNAYQKLKSHGMNFIADEQLKNELLTTYEVNGKWLAELNERNNQYEYQIAFPILGRLFKSIGFINLASFPINEEHSNRMVRDSMGYKYPSFDMMPIEYESLKNNETFMSILRTTINLREQSILSHEIRRQRMLRLTVHLDGEIDLKSNGN